MRPLLAGRAFIPSATDHGSAATAAEAPPRPIQPFLLLPLMRPLSSLQPEAPQVAVCGGTVTHLRMGWLGRHHAVHCMHSRLVFCWRGNTPRGAALGRHGAVKCCRMHTVYVCVCLLFFTRVTANAGMTQQLFQVCTTRACCRSSASW